MTKSQLFNRLDKPDAMLCICRWALFEERSKSDHPTISSCHVKKTTSTRTTHTVQKCVISISIDGFYFEIDDMSTLLCSSHKWYLNVLQLNEYETDTYCLQFFQSNTTVCLIIHVFCKSSEAEVVFCFDLHSCKTISRLQTLQNSWINNVVHWKFWRKYRSVSYLFSCNFITHLLVFWFFV